MWNITMSRAKEVKVGDYICFYDGAFVYQCDIERIHKMYPDHDDRDPWFGTVISIPLDHSFRFVNVDLGRGHGFVVRISEVYK